MMNAKPLRLTWTLVTPMVASAHPLHLDGLVAFAVTEEALRSGSAVSGPISAIAESLPLMRAVQDGKWCWKASVLRHNGGPQSTRFWTRKTDPYDYSDCIAKGKIEKSMRFPMKPFASVIDMQRGLMKQQFKFFPVRQVSQVTAWCIGDKDRLAELLDPEAGLITHLGAKTRSGFGRISSFNIEVDETAEELWKKRTMPWPEDGSVPVRLAIRPPYWEIKNIVDCFIDPEIF